MYTIDEINAVHFEPSSLCNARCPVCPRFTLGGVKNEKLKEIAVGIEQFKIWFQPEFLTQINQFQMCGNYGDPATTPDLIEICEYISEYNVSIIIHSNGGIRKPEFWGKLGKIKNLRVVFAIDGLKDTNHLYRRNVRWDAVMENTAAFISSGGHAQWSMLRFKHNQHQIEIAKNLSVRLGFKNFFSKKPYGFLNWIDQNNQPSEYESMLVLDNDGNYEYELYPENTEKENIPKFNTRIIPNNSYLVPEFSDWHSTLQSNDLSCHALNTKEIFVSSLGQVYPCCFVSGYWDNPSTDYQQYQFRELIKPYYTQLNLNNNDLESILNNEFYQKVMTTGMNKGKDRILACSIFCTKKPA